MKKLSNRVLLASSLLLLTACAGENGYKMQIEPSLPVPIMVVPDHGTTTAPANNQIYTPNNNQVNTPNDQYQTPKDSPRSKRPRKRGKAAPVNNNDQGDYQYQN